MLEELEVRIRDWARGATEHPTHFETFTKWERMRAQPGVLPETLQRELSREVGHGSIQFCQDELLNLADSETKQLQLTFAEAVLGEIDRREIAIRDMPRFQILIAADSPYNLLCHERQHLKFMSGYTSSAGVVFTFCGQKGDSRDGDYSLYGSMVCNRVDIECSENENSLLELKALCATEPDVLSRGDVSLARAIAAKTEDEHFVKVINKRIALRGQLPG